MKNNLNRFWINDEFNRTKKNPFVEPETDVKVQFQAPEIAIMGERNYITFFLIPI